MSEVYDIYYPETAPSLLEVTKDFAVSVLTPRNKTEWVGLAALALSVPEIRNGRVISGLALVAGGLLFANNQAGAGLPDSVRQNRF